MSETHLAQFQSLLARALKRFCVLIGGAPTPSDTSTWERDCQESLKVFSDLWAFQQDHRATLVEAGLTRADIGEIASKIGQLYYNLYLRTSGPSWLLESYTFFEAIHTRAYFSAGGLNQSVKQLKFYARFIVVCLLLNRKEEAWNLVQEFQALVSTFAMKFAAEDAQEWQSVVHSVTSFLNADVAMPVPRSPGTCIPFRPNFRCCVDGAEAQIAPHTQRLREVIFASYQHRQVKIAELPIDSFRMMLAMEWHDARLEVVGMEPQEQRSVRSTALAPSTRQPQEVSSSSGSSSSASAAPPPPPADPAAAAAGGPSDTQLVGVSGSSDPGTACAPGGAPAHDSPYKRLLHRTCAPVLLSFLAASVLGLGQDDILLLHLVGHGHFDDVLPDHQQLRQRQQQPIDAWSTFNPEDLQQQLAAARLGAERQWQPPLPPPEAAAGAAAPGAGGAGAGGAGAVSEAAPGSRGVLGNGVVKQRSPVGVLLSPASSKAEVEQSVITPEDLLPFTRRRLMLVVDSDASPAFARLRGFSSCPPPLCLLSPPHRPSALLSYTGTGAFFTMALTCPVMAFCLLLGEMDPSAQQLLRLQDALDEAVTHLGTALAAALGLAPDGAAPASAPAAADAADASGTVDGRPSPSAVPQAGDSGSPWALAFSDVLLRRLVLRFVVIRAALSMHISTRDRPDCQASCSPALPGLVDPGSLRCCSAVLSVAAVFQKEHLFTCPSQ